MRRPISKDLHDQVMRRANWHCEYCGVDLLESLNLAYTKHLEHLVPWSKGGLTDYENLVGSCFVCNAEKLCYVPTGATREEKLQDARAWLKPRVEKARLDYAELVKKVRGTA
jgi:5-methylcytosine-specific restriction endonuclease McrA